MATRHDGVVSVGTLTKWVPADGEDEALWHMAHDDGDGEDLDEAEVEAAMKLYAEVAGRLRAAARDRIRVGYVIVIGSKITHAVWAHTRLGRQGRHTLGRSGM